MSNKILLISNQVLHYRVSLYNYFFQEFNKNGWELRVVANRVQSTSQILRKFNLKLMPFGFLEYAREIKKNAPAAVILFLHLKNLIIWPLVHWLKLKRIPLIYWTKTRNLDEGDSFWRKLLFNYIMHLSDGIILYTSNVLPNVPLRARHKAFPANNTINFNDFPEVIESKSQIKTNLGIPFNKVVLFAGRISEEGNRKKTDHLVEIFRNIERSELGLVLVGSGMPDSLKKRMNPRNTLYLGEVHDSVNLQISRVFKMADIFSIPGHVGLGINQAFYFGLPIVTEAGSHPPEICYLQSGRNGFVVPENDIFALKEKILYLADNDTIRAEFSRNARADILANGSTENMFQGFLKCVEYVTRKK